MFKPTGNKMLVQWEFEKMPEGSKLVLAEIAKKKTRLGVIMAIGDAVKDDSFALGDRVMIEDYAGDEINTEEWGECVILKPCDLIAIVS